MEPQVHALKAHLKQYKAEGSNAFKDDGPGAGWMRQLALQ